ncbi:MAG: hypothetical protein AAGH72_04175 [Verrucomicrobiota bacterium]
MNSLFKIIAVVTIAISVAYGEALFAKEDDGNTVPSLKGIIEELNAEKALSYYHKLSKPFVVGNFKIHELDLKGKDSGTLKGKYLYTDGKEYDITAHRLPIELFHAILMSPDVSSLRKIDSGLFKQLNMYIDRGILKHIGGHTIEDVIFCADEDMIIIGKIVINVRGLHSKHSPQDADLTKLRIMESEYEIQISNWK